MCVSFLGTENEVHICFSGRATELGDQIRYGRVALS